MFKNLLKKIVGPSNVNTPIEPGRFVIAQLNDKIMPIYRGEFYEDPLTDYLTMNNLGEVTGGGTMQAESGEIEFCDLEIQININQDIDKIASGIIKFLEELGAPKGSLLKIEKTKDEIPFGNNEGLAIYLDGINLPTNVYQECDINFVLEELSRLIGYDGNVQRYWQGPTETALYFYGESFQNMYHAISEFVNSYPLCEGARIVQIA